MDEEKLVGNVFDLPARDSTDEWDDFLDGHAELEGPFRRPVALVIPDDETLLNAVAEAERQHAADFAALSAHSPDGRGYRPGVDSRAVASILIGVTAFPPPGEPWHRHHHGDLIRVGPGAFPDRARRSPLPRERQARPCGIADADCQGASPRR